MNPYKFKAVFALAALLSASASLCDGQQTSALNPSVEAVSVDLTPSVSPASEHAAVEISPSAIEKVMHVTVGKSIFLDSKATLSRVFVDNPAIVQTYAPTRNQVIISGIKTGSATVILYDQANRNTAYSVSADVDVTRLQDALESGFPFDKIHASSDQDMVILKGYVSSPDEYTQAGKLAAGYGRSVTNSLRIAPAHLRQVRLEVKFVEIERSKLDQFGINFLSLAKNVGMISTGQFPSFGSPTIGSGGSSSPGTASGSSVSSPLNLLLFNQGLNVGAAVQAASDKNVLQILAEPTIAALSGHKASFLAGGEFPFPSVQASAGTTPTVTIQFRPYGVTLNFLPVVLDDGTIRLHVAPEVSALDYTNSVNIAGYTVPALSSRIAETDVELKDGQTFALSGLLDRRVTDQMQKIPGIASLPIIGSLFKSKSVQRSASELLVFVTPHVEEQLSNPDPLPVEPKAVKPYLNVKDFDKSVNGPKK